MRFCFWLPCALLLAGCSVSTPTEPDPPVRPDSGYQVGPVPFRYIDTQPDWSPDGRTIAYTHEPSEVWTLDLATGRRRFVTRGRNADWSPDGRSLVFWRAGSIYVVHVSTKSERRVLACSDCAAPHWSPDGRQISFDVSQAFTGRSADIGVWVMNADGSSPRRVGPGILECWLPNGKEAVVSRYPDARTLPDLWRVALSDTTSIRLTTTPEGEGNADCTRDGRMISWTSSGPDPLLNGIWTAASDGSRPQLVLPMGGYHSFSPDGRRIVYAAPYAAERGALWIAAVDGSNRKLLTRERDY